MNSLEIEKVLRRQRRTAPHFRGCFPADRIPPHGEEQKYPWCAVVNTDRAHQSGTHWTAVYVPTPRTIEYFDSFAQPPNECISRALKTYTHVVQNRHCMQSLFSSVCGKYAIYFLMRRCGGDSFDEIVERLRTSRTPPDRLVSAYVSRLFFS